MSENGWLETAHGFSSVELVEHPYENDIDLTHIAGPPLFGDVANPWCTSSRRGQAFCSARSRSTFPNESSQSVSTP
jgi:hypothetical protein